MSTEDARKRLEERLSGVSGEGARALTSGRVEEIGRRFRTFWDVIPKAKQLKKRWKG